MAGAYYAWRVAGKPAEVLLDLSVVERMQAGVLHAQLRDGDPDHWGLLLGRTRRGRGVRTAIVEDFEPLPVEPKRGRLKAPSGSRLKVLGVYRSSPGETFRLDAKDAAVIGSAFHDPAMVYLLIRPERGQASHAAFFIQEEAVVHGYASYLVFPFHADLLREHGALEYENVPAGHKRAWAAAAALVMGLAVIGGWYVRPVAAPPMPEAPPLPIMETQGSADRVKPPPTKRTAHRAARKRPIRSTVTRAKPATPLQAVGRSERGADSGAHPTSNPASRFRRLLSKVPGLRGLD